MLIISKSNVRNRVINAGLAFTAATYICYFLTGMGLFTAIRVTGLQHYIYFGVSILSIVIGLWNTKDFFWYERGVNIEVPQSWRPKIKQITRGVTSTPGAFALGCLMSVFLAPCTSGPYAVIIGMLGSTATRMQAIWLLLIYNVIFVLPFIIITFGVGFGLTSPAIVEKLRQKWLRGLHLATGIFMLVLGAAMIALLTMGII
jgi:cytochrome c biogenesis protein CcdA